MMPPCGALIRPHSDLHQCPGKLEHPQREVVSLAYLRNLSHSDLAAQLKLPLGSRSRNSIPWPAHSVDRGSVRHDAPAPGQRKPGQARQYHRHASWLRHGIHVVENEIGVGAEAYFPQTSPALE